MSDDALTVLIDQEESLKSVKSLDELREHLLHRDAIQQQLQQLEIRYKKICERVRRLPVLPPLQTIQWAQSVRAMPNVVFLEVDTTGLYEDAEIIRVVVLDKQGNILLNKYVRPERPLSTHLQRITGIDLGELSEADCSISDVLNELRSTIQGTYVLSYNMNFDVEKLNEATRREHLPEIIVVGEDLMMHAMRYFNLSSYPKLEMLCQRIEQPLPSQPFQNAIDRAKGQIALLTAIADVGSPQSTSYMPQENILDDDDLDLDESPF